MIVHASSSADELGEIRHEAAGARVHGLALEPPAARRRRGASSDCLRRVDVGPFRRAGDCCRGFSTSCRRRSTSCRFYRQEGATRAGPRAARRRRGAGCRASCVLDHYTRHLAADRARIRASRCGTRDRRALRRAE